MVLRKNLVMDSSGLGGGFLCGSNGGILELESQLQRRQTTHSGHSGTEKGVSAIDKGKGPALVEGNHGYTLSDDDDEPSYTEDGSGENCDAGAVAVASKGKKGNPWQRMKWTDDVVKLLVGVVACVGDDGMVGGGGEGNKRKSGAFQKKGKWKTVSKIMISKGCHVSPQQCEDKFNDLNKRYKRLNDILGRGTSCRVVENPGLMESMPHLSPKAKDDVRKILSSKHLFYKEMCAYHNGQRIPDCHDIDLQPIARCLKEDNNGYEDEDEEEEESEENHDIEHEELDNNNADGEERESEFVYRKKARSGEVDGHFCDSRPPEDSFEGEMAGVFEDPTKLLWERRDWVKKRAVHLEEQRVNFEAEALELEKQRFRWVRYCGKKDRELERLRIENERMKLENERKVLHLRQKELELGMRRSLGNGIGRALGRDHIDLARPQ